MSLRLAGWILAALGLLGSTGCLQLRPTVVPLPELDLSPPGAHRTLVVFLPGRRDRPEDFRRHGFAELAERQGVSADFVAVDAHMGYYVEKSIVLRLREDILAAARRRYERIWLVGISIGGTGALLYAAEHPEDVDGIVLLAPFLGNDPVIDEVESAGGLLRWTPPPPDGSDDFEHRIWSFARANALGAARAEQARALPIYLGCGAQDRFARAAALLGRGLPAGRTFSAPGGHGWGAWTALWQAALRAGALRDDRPSS